jgi:hypothetical protein
VSVPRGFKAKANRIALALRHQLSLDAVSPIDLAKLAARLRLPLVPLDEFTGELPGQVAQLTLRDPGAFSAVLLPLGRGQRIILFNDRHSPPRRNSSIAHEIAHALLAHPPTLPFDGTGCRTFDKEIEDEASCLAGYILIPNEAAWHIVRSQMSAAEACPLYGVSQEMLDYRLDTSGARIRYSRRLIRAVGKRPPRRG